MYKLMSKMERIGSGEYIRCVLEHARARGGPFGATTQFDTAKKETHNAARYPWSYFWSGATIDIDDMVQISGGDSDVDLVMSKLDNMQASIRSYMGDCVWMTFATAQATYGGATKPFYGIPDLMAQTDTSPAYGRINRADLGYQEDGTTYVWTAFQDTDPYVMAFETVQRLRRGCSINNDAEGKPDLYITTMTLKDAFELSLTPSQRFPDPELAKVGFDAIRVGTRGSMVDDDKCTAGYVNAFNFMRMYLKVHQEYDFTKPVWKEPIDRPIKTTQTLFAGAVCTSERRAHGQLTNVSAS